jgi:hyperosmotically inducible protein
MNTTQITGKHLQYAMNLGAVILVSGLALGTNMAPAASDDATLAPSKAAIRAERVVSDSWITTKAKSEILANSGSEAFNVSVKTKSGAVSLKGKLPNQDAIDLVKVISEKVKSVDVSGLVIGASGVACGGDAIGMNIPGVTPVS